MPSDDTLVLHSSRWRLVLQASAPVVLFGLAALGLDDGSSPVVLVLLVLGALSAGVVLLDLPLRSEFDGDGVVRVCVLRRHRVPWDQVIALERSAGAPTRWGRGGDRPAGPARSRGLVARTGRRRLHLLVDRRESHAEWDALRSLLRERATSLRATEPALDAEPAGRGPRALHRRP